MGQAENALKILSDDAVLANSRKCTLSVATKFDIKHFTVVC
jgi:hypothetical protein